MCKGHSLLSIDPDLTPHHVPSTSGSRTYHAGEFLEVNVSEKLSQAGNYSFTPASEFPKHLAHTSVTSLNIGSF